MVILRDIRLRWYMLSLSSFYCLFFSILGGRGSEIGSFAGSFASYVFVCYSVNNHP